MTTTTTIPAKTRSVEEQITAGVDVGSSAVKIAVLRTTSGGETEVLTLLTERIRRRELRKVVDEGYQAALGAAGVAAEEVCYVASTGEGELVDFRRGHFYGMTTHARGAIFLMPEVRAVLDVGALHARAMRIDERSRVLSYRMTGQCASGSGQFLENVARYLGIALEDIGPLSCRAGNPQVVSSICAVLAETDVINMVSRGITTPDILKGIHLSMAGPLHEAVAGDWCTGPGGNYWWSLRGHRVGTGVAGKIAGGWSGRGNPHPSQLHLRRRAGRSFVGSLSPSHAGPPSGGIGMTGVNQLAGKTAVVTGGSGGIGSAIVRSLQEAGAVATSLDLSPPPDHDIPWLHCDVRSDESVGSAVQQFFQQNGRLDLVIHAAGISREAVVWKLAVEDWDMIQAVNLRGAFLLLRHTIPLMRQGQGGRVVLIGSINGSRGKFGTSAYSASKAGLLGLAKSVARETGRFGILVNVIEPGWVRTPLTEALPSSQSARPRKRKA